MSLQQLNILINDTKVGTTVLNIEKAERKALQLKYDGGDDEYKALIASQLSFNMVVEDAADAHFFHLFTGEETRYEVQLEEADTNNLLWQGHLLPDQYSEPYEGGCFFVNFTATDGLGILKNKYLPTDFYKETKSIPKILGACLQLTANQFHMIIAPAIENAAKDLYVVDQEIDTSLFINDNKKKNAYEILESLVTAMGCNLFQYAGYWYIIGINRKNDTSVNCEFYSLSGNKYVADNITSFSRTITSVLFEANPQITAIPPFKTVVVNWDKEQRENIFTKLVYKQTKEELTTLSGGVYTYGPPVLWTQVGAGYGMVAASREIYDTSANEEQDQTYYLGLMNTAAIADSSDKYIELDNSISIPKIEKHSPFINAEIKAVLWLTVNPSTNVENGDFKQKLLYDLTLNNTTILSNKAAFDTNERYDFEIKNGYTKTINSINYYTVEFNLKIENIKIPEAGLINIKLHPCETVVGTNSRVVFEQLDFNYIVNDTNETLTKERDIDFTTLHEVDIQYAYERNDLIRNQFRISPFIHLDSYEFTVSGTQKAISVLNFSEKTYTNYITNTTVTYFEIEINQNDYQLLTNDTEHLYKKDVTGVFTHIPYYFLTETTNSSTGYLMTIYDLTINLSATDDLYYKITAQTITETDDNYMREAWKRVGTSENVSYPEALAKMYHSTVRDTKFKIEGTLFGLFNPLSILQFRYINPKNYNPTTLTLQLDEGMTDVVMVESSNKEINDYE